MYVTIYVPHNGVCELLNSAATLSYHTSANRLLRCPDGEWSVFETQDKTLIVSSEKEYTASP